MGSSEKLREKAENTLGKAERLMDNERWNKASQEFQHAGELYLELREFRIAEQCYFYASRAAYRDEKYYPASLQQQAAARCCLELDDYIKARDYFDISAKSALKTGMKNAVEFATVNVSMAFFCYFIQGKQEDGITYIKKFRSDIDAPEFDTHPLMEIIRTLMKAMVNQKESYIDEIIDQLPKIKVDPREEQLLKHALIVALVALMTTFTLGLTITEYERDQLIDLRAEYDYSRLAEFEKYTDITYKFTSLVITDIEIGVSDHISTKEKMILPYKLPIPPYGKTQVPLKFRTNFPGDATIGPISIGLEIDGKFRFVVKSERQDLKITSPRAMIGVNLKPLKTPIINQSFPVEVAVSNNSDGNALEVEIEFQFLEEKMVLMRGTFKKQIYSLSPNEQFKWEITVKALDTGDIPVKVIVAFKDGDENPKGPFTADLFITINL